MRHAAKSELSFQSKQIFYESLNQFVTIVNQSQNKVRLPQLASTYHTDIDNQIHHRHKKSNCTAVTSTHCILASFEPASFLSQPNNINPNLESIHLKFIEYESSID